jgi:hypothetical protein
MSSIKIVKNITKNYLKAITDEDFRENAISKNRYFGDRNPGTLSRKGPWTP